MSKYLKNSFRVDRAAMPYSVFIPKLFNFCLSLGMQPHKIMPSRAFCSDENQGYPSIVITKHFGMFPFNHGRVGGIVSTDRNEPHSNHGKDMVIIQASHVGYEPETGEVGIYKRLQTNKYANDCGAICRILSWYQDELAFAQQQILLDSDDNEKFIVIDNQLLKRERNEGLFLHLSRLIENHDADEDRAMHVYSTSRAYPASKFLINKVGDRWPEQSTPIGKLLDETLYYFKHELDTTGASGHLNNNLIKAMPKIISSPYPAMTAAQINSQMEFDRTYRTIVREKTYHDKILVLISGINIDISPRPGELFPSTIFVPWAAYVEKENGVGYKLEQGELINTLKEQSEDNPHQIDLTAAIKIMEQKAAIPLNIDGT